MACDKLGRTREIRQDRSIGPGNRYKGSFVSARVEVIDARLEGVPEAVGEAAVLRGPRGGLSGRLQARAGLRAGDAAARAGRGAGPVRDAGGAAGPGRLRDVLWMCVIAGRIGAAAPGLRFLSDVRIQLYHVAVGVADEDRPQILERELAT